MSTLVAPHVHLWTRNEYHQMAELGWFARQRVELIEGQVIDMSPMGSGHATAVALTPPACATNGVESRPPNACFTPGTRSRNCPSWPSIEI